MKERKLAKVFYADLWGLRDEKYEYLFKNDVSTTQWQELQPVAPYYFFVPKDFALWGEYEEFWKVTEIFKKWSSGIKTHRDHFVVGFTKEEIVQRLRIFTGSLSDDLVKEALKLKDTGTWKLSETRKELRGVKLEDRIYPYAYRPFDVRWICYETLLIDRDRWPFMKHLLKKNLALCLKRSRYIKTTLFHHVFVSAFISDVNFFGDQTWFFPLYLYPSEPEGRLFGEGEAEIERIPNFTAEFLQAAKESLGIEPTPEQLFYYIYAVLYSPPTEDVTKSSSR